MTISFTASSGNPRTGMDRVESFNITVQILSITPYLASAVPTGGMNCNVEISVIFFAQECFFMDLTIQVP